MNRYTTMPALIVLVSLLGSSAIAQDHRPETSIDAGRKLALAVCSTCHVVAPDQEAPPRLFQYTPSFEEIANRPNLAAESLRLFITTTHWDQVTTPMTMPNPMLMDNQTSDVINYILSLRSRPGAPNGRN